MEQFIGATDLPKGSRIVVAMSGGVDSSLVAALLHLEGYDVVGITLQLYDQEKFPGQGRTNKTCCAGQDVYDAKQVAETFGFPHYVLNYESRFQESVMEDFADTYLAGQTPIPCVRCNQKVKFKDLLETARTLGAKALATGHYVKRVVRAARTELHRAHDHSKDQSYFLFATTQEQLDFLRFPLGHWTKHDVRQKAAEIGLTLADKPDSQDICFVPHGSYARVVEKLRPGALEPGDIVHMDGTVLGRHEGIINYTVGQRRGLGISSPTPLFVIKLDPQQHHVIVGPQEALACHSVTLNEVNWLEPMTDKELMIKFRSSQDPLPAKVTKLSDHKGLVHFQDPQYGVAPGQACVFYDGARVLGGGWIG